MVHTKPPSLLPKYIASATASVSLIKVTCGSSYAISAVRVGAVVDAGERSWCVDPGGDSPMSDHTDAGGSS